MDLCANQKIGTGDHFRRVVLTGEIIKNDFIRLICLLLVLYCGKGEKTSCKMRLESLHSQHNVLFTFQSDYKAGALN